MKPKVVTSGVDAEYVLAEVSNRLRAAGADVLEFDFGKCKRCVQAELEALADEEVVYITSAHTNLTRRVAEVRYPPLIQRYPHFLSPLEILPILKPGLTIYVPHDLLTPFGDANLDEYRFLDLFDHVLAPYDAEKLQAKLGDATQVHDAGWVKYRHNEDGVRDTIDAQGGDLKVTMFVSFVDHLRDTYGVRGFVEYLRPLLSKSVRVKLPVWDGIEAMEDALSQHSDAMVVPATVNSIDLIASSDVVICNGASSIQAESTLMGVPTICVLDNEVEPAESKQRKLSAFPHIHYHDYSQRAPFPTGYVEQVRQLRTQRQLKPFDFSLVQSLVQSHAEKRRRRTYPFTPLAELMRQCGLPFLKAG